MKRSDVEAGEEAIRLVEAGAFIYSCNALDHVSAHNQTLARRYGEYVASISGGEWPVWWSSNNHCGSTYRRARIEMLTAFRDHLLEQAK